jgi:hypothetical protein
MESTAAERYYQKQLERSKNYYERNKDSIAQKRREKRVEANPEIQGRGKFKKEKLSQPENK